MSRSIAVKKDIVLRMESRFEGFLFESAGSGIYTFQRKNPDRLFDYISVFREFYEGNGYLSVSLVSTCYNLRSKGIPWFAVGTVKSIGQLITGKNAYDANTGVYQYENTKEGLHQALTAIEGDVERFVLPFFTDCHRDLAKDKVTRAVVEVMDTALPALQPYQLESFRQWMRQTGGKDKPLWESELHPLFDQWLESARIGLGYGVLKESAHKKAVKVCIFLVRDYFGFND